MYTATMIINKLMEYYNVHTISELAEIIKIGQPAISKWKNNNSINPIKKKCKELGIYNEIFDNLDSKNNLSNCTDPYEIDKDDYYYKLNLKTINAPKDFDKLMKNNNIIDIDNGTFSLFKEAYISSINIDDIKNFRIHLMNFTFEFSNIKNNFNTYLKLEDNDQIDLITFNLFIEAYKVAQNNNKLKEFRLHLMEYTFDSYKLANPE
jgi:hypothetical protein